MAAAALPGVPAALKEALRPLPATEWAVEGGPRLSESLPPDSCASQATSSCREGRHSVLARQVLLISVWGQPAGQWPSQCESQVAHPSLMGLKTKADSHRSHHSAHMV